MNQKGIKLDFMLLFILFTLIIVSVVSIYSAQQSLPSFLQEINFVKKQLIWYVIGTVALSVTMIIDFDRFKQISWYMYAFGMLLLLGIEFNFPAKYVLTIKGATAWYDVPGIGNFQPSEVMKIFLIILVSQIIANHNEKRMKRTMKDDLFLLGKIMAICLPPLLLIAKQPDLGNTMVLSAIIASLILVSGIRWRFIFSIVGLVVTVGTLLVSIYFMYPDFFKENILDSYQLDRFYGWLAPYEYDAQGYQLRQALLAIGSGELYGKGYSDGEVYFPEPHTDFIFAVIAEEFGFIGGSIVVSLFFLLVYRMIHTALESHDPYGSYLCTGVIGMITFQVFQNIGMTVGVLPITGIPLPFVSYGGSALLTFMLAIGIVLNVHSRTKNICLIRKLIFVSFLFYFCISMIHF
ncbi:rod shape-determining protein RodA [Bacillus sp. HMF5848]|uniref:FtsW/RodA/SpoVE family cell cycle protein n=1 Tax=Bacillus sp. HMF5848 TaxID=2495421 RepID=UPI000F77F7C4|nr:FtsW/RodA/SpoVE family cell cycle protein [Bacillus sp. HMF5848]RSK26503.1 rod shape-determining protein RodA [Bacillus sp. HMF5848]